jgi:HlyD family secretion protein
VLNETDEIKPSATKSQTAKAVQPLIMDGSNSRLMALSRASAEQRKRRVYWGAGIAVGLVALLLIANVVFSRVEETHASRPLYLPVQRTSFASVLHELGSIEALNEIMVLTRFSGDIVWRTEDGKAVEEGEPLVKFETKTVVEDIEQREKDLLDKKDAVRRAEEDIKTATERYKSVIRQAEITLAEAEIDRKRIYDDPTPDDKLDAELTLKSASLELKQAELELSGYEDLAKQGFVSQAALKKKQLDVATIRVNHAKAKVLYDLTLQGNTPDAKRVADLAVSDAKKRRNIASFNRDADLSVAKAALEVARVDLANFERELIRKRQDLDAATVRAPKKGNVVFTEVMKGSTKSKSPIQVGESRTAGGDLCTLCDTSVLRVNVWINESDVKGLVLGQHATVTLPASPGRTYDAIVSQLAVMAQDKNAAISSLALRKAGEAFVNVVQVRLDFINLSEADRKAIKVGFTADVFIETTEKSDALTIPWAGVRYDEQLAPFAEVVTSGGGREKRGLKLGRSNGDRVEVLSGLKEGEQVFDQTIAISGGPRS